MGAVKTEALKSQLAAQGNQAPQRHQGNPLKALLDSPAVKKRFEEVLNKRAPQYMSSIVNLVNSDVNLAKCDPMSIIGSCMVAATLNLPIEKNLGYAWVIPYGSRAQFQLGARGYIQLALRTAQYRKINVTEVYEGELVEFNRLTEEITFDQSQKTSDAVIGYAAYFELVNGFKKTVYWTKQEVEKHRDRFSKGANRTDSPWKTDFNAMAEKTVLKHLLSKWGILSIEMQEALATDEHGVVMNQDGETTSDVFDLTPNEFTEEETAAKEAAAGVQETAAYEEPQQGGLNLGGDIISDDELANL